MEQLLHTIIFFLPAYASNMGATLSKYIPFFKNLLKPIKKSAFGSNKTIGGSLFAILLGTLTSIPLYYIAKPTFLNLNSYSYFFYFSLFTSLGAVLGDITKSFIKRKLKIKSGRPWPPFDQIDFILGATLFASFITKVPGYIIILGLLITPILHLSTNIIAYKLKIKDVWW